MLIKFTSGGRGGGKEVCRYLIDPKRPGREEQPPELLRGDLERTRELIDSIDREWTYSHGVLSFALEDAPTEEQQREAMDAFEAFAFAGLDREQFDISWVRHQHTEGGRVELHFVTPRMDLTSGRALNIAPPGWEGAYATLRDELNLTHAWARPDDPERARDRGFDPPWQTAGFRLKEQREAVQGYVESLIEAGGVRNRAEMVQALTEAGLEVTRQGEDYLGLKDPQTGEKLRLKGGIYGKGWTYDAELERAAGRTSRKPERRDRGDDGSRIEEARRRCTEARDKRARAHEERYSRPERGIIGDPAAAILAEKHRRRDLGVPDRELDGCGLIALAVQASPTPFHGLPDGRQQRHRIRDPAGRQPTDHMHSEWEAGALRRDSESEQELDHGSIDPIRARFTKSIQYIGRRIREISDDVQGAFERVRKTLGAYFQAPNPDRGEIDEDRSRSEAIKRCFDQSKQTNGRIRDASAWVDEKIREINRPKTKERSRGFDRDFF